MPIGVVEFLETIEITKNQSKPHPFNPPRSRKIFENAGEA